MSEKKAESNFDFKQVVVGLTLLGLLAWNASIQVGVNARHANKVVKSTSGEKKVEIPIGPTLEGLYLFLEGPTKPTSRPTRIRRRRSSGSGQASRRDTGVVFTRWGLKECPDVESELVYSGIVGSSRHNETGGSTEYLCMPDHPQYAKYTDALEGTGRLYGVEFEVGTGDFLENNGPSGLLQDADVMCAVCRAKGRASTIMIPGRKTCVPGWRKEYWGYIMTSHNGHLAQNRFACVDSAARGAERGSRSENGGLMYHVQGVCGSLSCPKYVQGRELSCVVCTK